MPILKGAKKEITVSVKAKLLEEDGREIEAKLKTTFKRIKLSEAQAIMLKARKGETTDEQIIRDHLIAVDGFKDDNDKTIPYSPELLEQALEIKGYVSAFIEGFMKVHFGLEAVQKGN